MLKGSFRGDQGSLRLGNRRSILNLIRRHGPLSRTRLSELTGLSAAAVTGVTAQLITDRLLLEQSIGEAGPSGGRRPVFLDIDYGAHYAVGMKITEQYIDAVLTDLSTSVIAHQFEVLQHTSPEQVVKQIVQICQDLLKLGKVSPSSVIGIGLGFAGVVDSRRGLVVRLSRLGWDNVPIAEMVSKKMGLPTWVDNDLNAFAEVERLFGHGKLASNFLVVAIGRGTGSALVLNGEVYRGSLGGAGEFGHNQINPGGRQCSCGRRGCLEAYTCESAILGQFCELHPERLGLDINGLVQLAESGHADARAVMTEAGNLLGRHVSYMVNTLNPERIIFGGEGTRMGEFFFGPLIRRIKADAYDGLADALECSVVPWHDNDYTPWARGAASLAVEHAFATAALSTVQ
jgi:predicted NBD/HSP70 family sugar kinase